MRLEGAATAGDSATQGSSREKGAARPGAETEGEERGFQRALRRTKKTVSKRGHIPTVLQRRPHSIRHNALGLLILQLVFLVVVAALYGGKSPRGFFLQFSFLSFSCSPLFVSTVSRILVHFGLGKEPRSTPT